MKHSNDHVTDGEDIYDSATDEAHIHMTLLQDDAKLQYALVAGEAQLWPYSKIANLQYVLVATLQQIKHSYDLVADEAQL
jgi:hypothetical protein